MSLTRRDIREKALQALFQLSANEGLTIDQAIQQALTSEDELQDEVEVVEVPKYLDLVVTGVLQNQAIIDEKIQANLENWSMNRLAKTDLIIMRVAILKCCMLQTYQAELL